MGEFWITIPLPSLGGSWALESNKKITKVIIINLFLYWTLNGRGREGGIP